jgi:glutamyl/glutaminyl-tRNA synthetase
LGIDYVKPITYTSNHFDLLEEYCTKLILEGKAFVDDTEGETVSPALSSNSST